MSPRAGKRVQSALASVRVDTSALPRSHFESYYFFFLFLLRLSFLNCHQVCLKKKGGDEKRDIKAKKPLKKVFIFHSLLCVERVVCFRTCVKFVLKTFFPIELGAVISFGNYRANVSCLPTYRIASGRVILAVWVIRLLKKKGRNKNKNKFDSFCKWRDDVLVSFQFQFELVLLSRELLLLF